MNQDRAQPYLTALLAAILLFTFSSVGSLVDQAAGVTLDRALIEQFQDCVCLEAGVPLTVNIIRANFWTLAGAVGGLLLGLAIGWVWRLTHWGDRRGGRAPVVTVDAARWQPEQLARLGGEVKSALIVPLVHDEDRIGVLGVGSTQETRRFTAAEADLAANLARELAAAAANARLHHGIEKQLNEQLALNRIRQALAEAGDMAQVAEAVYAPVSAALGVDTFYLARLDAETGVVEFALMMEGGQRREVLPLPPQGVIDHILKTRQPLRLSGEVNRALEEMGLVQAGSDGRREEGVPASARAFLGLPLLNGEDTLGVLAAEDPQLAETFDDEQMAWMQAIAREAAAAVERVSAQAAAARASAALESYRTQFEQASQAAKSFEQQLRAHEREQTDLQARYAEAIHAAEALDKQARAHGQDAAEARERHAAAAATAQQLAQTLALHGDGLRQWRARASALLAAQNPPKAIDLPALLERELLLASRAMEASYAALYVPANGEGRLHISAAAGNEADAASQEFEDLARAAIRAEGPIYVADLQAEAHRPTPATNGSPAMGDAATPDGTGTAAEAAPVPADETVTITNGRFRSGLALPLPTGENGQPGGAVVFMTGRTDGFAVEKAPVARAAASQLAFALQSAAVVDNLQALTARFRELLDEPAANWDDALDVDDLALGPLPPAAEEAGVALPSLAPLPPLPEAEAAPKPLAEPTRRVAPLLEPVPVAADPAAAPPEFVRLSPRPAWRRAVMPVGVVLAAACGLTIAFRGPLSGLATGVFSGAATATAPAATATAPAILAATATPEQSTPAPTEPPPTTTLSPTATQTEPPTETATAAETSTLTSTPRPTLPPDVVAVATVNLPAGIGGRLRDGPNGNVIGGVPGNTEVHVLAGRETTPDGIVWVQIRSVETGQSGWFAEDLLIYQDASGG